MKVLFHLFGFPINFLGVMVALGMLAGIFIAYLEVRRKKLEVDKVFDIAIYSMVSAVVGARLFYILFYNPSYYLKNPIIGNLKKAGLDVRVENNLMMDIVKYIACSKNFRLLLPSPMAFTSKVSAWHISREGCLQFQDRIVSP